MCIIEQEGLLKEKHCTVADINESNCFMQMKSKHHHLFSFLFNNAPSHLHIVASTFTVEFLIK